MTRRAAACAALLAAAAAAKEPDMVDKLIAASQEGSSFVEVDLRAGGIALSPDEVARAAGYVAAHPDASGYHLLLALRRQAPEAYAKLPAATRAAVLCAALGHLTTFNDWGHLGTLPAEGAATAALVEAGRDALPCLAPLLDDRRPAPFFGSKDAAISSGYRRADFAYRCAARILGERPRFAASVEARDRAIARLKRALAKKK